MTHYSISLIERSKQVVLSVPVQAALFIGLSSLTVWTLYFSPYPPAHNTLHQTRHHTLGIPCH